MGSNHLISQVPSPPLLLLHDLPDRRTVSEGGRGEEGRGRGGEGGGDSGHDGCDRNFRGVDLLDVPRCWGGAGNYF